MVGEAGSGMEAIHVCRNTRPDLVVVDLMLPELNGLHLTRLLLDVDWPARVVVYSGVGDLELLREALAVGPHGLVCKDDSLKELMTALRVVMAGSRHISTRAERLLSNNGNGHAALTTQERAVLQMIAEGQHTKEIATALGASQKTAEHHREHVMKKLDLHDVASLTRFAVCHRLVSA